MSEHVVTFTARVVDWKPASGAPWLRASLVAECSCGWAHDFVPKPGREHAIIAYGLAHVEKSAND